MADRDVAGKKIQRGRAEIRAERGGTVGYVPTWEQEQNVLSFRKILLRRHMLRWVRHTTGAFYVPFMGDGDIAAQLYRERTIYGADLDPSRVQMAKARFPGADIREADCDSWPFPDVKAPFCWADFDAFSEPYASFRSFWAHAPKAKRVVVVFTDGHRQGLNRTGWWTHPSGQKIRLGSADGPRMGDRDKKLPVYGAYLSRYVWPWFEELFATDGWRTLDRWRYQRDMMIYWGMAVER